MEFTICTLPPRVPVAGLASTMARHGYAQIRSDRSSKYAKRYVELTLGGFLKCYANAFPRTEARVKTHQQGEAKEAGAEAAVSVVLPALSACVILGAAASS